MSKTYMVPNKKADPIVQPKQVNQIVQHLKINNPEVKKAVNIEEIVPENKFVFQPPPPSSNVSLPVFISPIPYVEIKTNANSSLDGITSKNSNLHEPSPVVIGLIEDIQALNSHKNEPLELYFGSYRSISEIGPNNFLTGLISGIVDYSIAYQTTDIIEKIQMLFNQPQVYDKEILEILNNLFERIKRLTQSSEAFRCKNIEINAIYQSWYYLVRCMRICSTEATRLFYNSENYQMIRDINSFDNVSIETYLETILMETSTLQLHDYLMLLDCLSLEVTIVNSETLLVKSIGSSTKHQIHLLEIKNSYYPLHTIEQKFIQSENSHESSQLLQHRNAELQKKEAEIAEILNQTKQAEINTYEAATIFTKALITINPNMVISEDVSLFGDIKTALKDFICSYCQKVTFPIVLQCGHRLCHNDLQGLFNSQINHCKLCSFPIDQKFAFSFFQ